MIRPEYITCVADTHEDNKGKTTWCGKQQPFSFTFTSVDHAVLNGRSKGRLIVCPECLSAITAALTADWPPSPSPTC